MHIAGLLHLTLESAGGDLLIAIKDEGVDFYLVAAFDIESDDETTRTVGLLSGGGHFHTGVPFFDEVALDFVRRGAEHILSHHIAGLNLDFLAEFFILAFLHAGEGKFQHAGTFAKNDGEECNIALDAGDSDLHIVEHTLFPEVLDGTRNFVARDFHLVAHLQTCHKLNNTMVEIVGALEGDASNFVCFGSQVVEVIFRDTTHNNLGMSHHWHHRQHDDEQ